MYAIVQTGGKQYKVASDDVLTVEKIEGEPGSKVELSVIFVNDGKKIITDPAKLAKAHVTAEIVKQFKGEKQLVYKFKRRKRYHKLKGHRQMLTMVKICDIKASGRTTKKAAETAATEPAAE
ncbi:50S ribosomal protein L21 [Collinsella sp. AGMB00827]|uniref:Large ribosomal subunit protein bL21 n=1 Tax=Collinsella ureilytica TaxID=2869515 RepID=A0ABS7ML88_9ACTN|nr:50S ribosomal protein L21 [Collinsella urealyticum]MBY4798062.1 50S ribosomal protein L21 [Collinsella urealyticum]